MSPATVDLKLLAAPFLTSDIEWRVQQAAFSPKGDPYAMVLAYVTNRAVMDRLDEVVGPGAWRNEYREGPVGGVICGLSIKIDGEWITKWDGAENTQVEGVKGGLSSAMKRAAVQWGIGRYLYYLENQQFAIFSATGKHKMTIADTSGKKHRFRWDPPALPDWAKPGKAGAPPDRDQDTGGMVVGSLGAHESEAEERAAKPVQQPSQTAAGSGQQATATKAAFSSSDDILQTRIEFGKKLKGCTVLEIFEKDPDYGASLIAWIISKYKPASNFAEEQKRNIRALKAAHLKVLFCHYIHAGEGVDPTDNDTPTH